MTVTLEKYPSPTELTWQQIVDNDPLALSKLRNLGADLEQMNIDTRPLDTLTRQYSELLSLVIFKVNKILSARKIQNDKGNYCRLDELKSQAQTCQNQLDEFDPSDDESLSRLIYWANYIEDEVNQRAAIIAYLEKRGDHPSLKKKITTFFT